VKGDPFYSYVELSNKNDFSYGSVRNDVYSYLIVLRGDFFYVTGKVGDVYATIYRINRTHKGKTCKGYTYTF
jgi:hypothetical protein